MQASAIQETEEDVEFEVTPWGGGVEVRPLLVVSDCTGMGATRLAHCAWAQFGSPEDASVTVIPEVRGEADVRQAVEQAVSKGADASLPEGCGGALVLHTVASLELAAVIGAECQSRRVPCIDLLQPLLMMLETKLGQRGSKPASETTKSGNGPPIFAVSDSTGTTVCDLVRSALQQFPGRGIEEITVCPEVRSLEEITIVAQSAAQEGGVVAFSFASTGMSRYMRQQCENLDVAFTDIYQPMLLAMEIYLEYPSIGVPGGFLDLKDLSSAKKKWQQKKV